jgi:alkanesulfonate monooxygenase SsuD/methylene tetrahydromethanopterin reductase-like flavin-dependent oxidoreductase (luciferase family)
MLPRAGKPRKVEWLVLDQAVAVSVVGSPDTVRHGLAEFIRKTGADELMVTSQIFDHEARLRSFEITAEARGGLVLRGEAAARS